MIKRPKARSRKDQTNTIPIKKKVSDILSENILPVKNIASSQLPAVISSADSDISKITSALDIRKRGGIVQSESRLQYRYTIQDPELLVPIKIEEQSPTTQPATSIICSERNRSNAGEENQRNRVQKHVHFRYPLNEEENMQEENEYIRSDSEDMIQDNSRVIVEITSVLEEDGNSRFTKENLKTNKDNSSIERGYSNMEEDSSYVEEDNSDIERDNLNMEEDGSQKEINNLNMVEDNGSKPKEDMTIVEKNGNAIEVNGNSTEDKNKGDEAESNLYCSVCLSPQTTKNFISHIKEEHNEKGSALGWGEFSLPVLLPLCYAIQNENIALKKRRVSTTIKHPELIPNPEDPSFYCKACERTYGDRPSYRIHIIRVHNMNVAMKPYPWAIVNPMSFPDPDNPNLYCVTCDKYFSSSSSFIVHIKFNHYAGIHQTYNCEICLLPYGKSEYLDRHMLNKHKIKRIERIGSSVSSRRRDENSTSLDCPSCKSSFLSIQSYLEHVDTHYNNKKRIKYRKAYAIPNPADNDLFCSACQEYYYDQTTFLRHLCEVHIIESPGYKVRCKYLKRSSTNSEIITAIKSTRRTRGPTINRKISDLFNPESSSNTEVKRRRQPKRVIHCRVVHPEVMPDAKDEHFYCGSCEIKLPSQNDYFIHLQNQHNYISKDLPQISPSSASNPTYACSLCHCNFKNRNLFSDHLQSDHHMKLAEPATIGDFSCEICFEEFRGKVHLAEHIDDEHPHISSNGKKFFVCCYCNVNCFNANGLGLHKQNFHDISFVYDDINLYCNLCDRVSPSLEKYDRHLRVHKISVAEIKREKGEKERAENVIEKEESNLVRMSSLPRVVHQHKTPNLLQSHDKPDISDPNNTHCNVCKLTYNSTTQYRLHCIKYHKMDLQMLCLHL